MVCINTAHYDSCAYIAFFASVQLENLPYLAAGTSCEHETLCPFTPCYSMLVKHSSTIHMQLVVRGALRDSDYADLGLSSCRLELGVSMTILGNSGRWRFTRMYP